MKCPRCSSRQLRVGVVFSGELTCQFHSDDAIDVLDTAALDSIWDPGAECACLQCSWSGRVSEAGFHEAEEEEDSQPALSEEELLAIQRELDSEECPEELAGMIRSLVKTVKTLQTQLQIVRRTSRRREGDEGVPGDTHIF